MESDLALIFMPRIARIIIPSCPHHVIQRGNRKQRVFFYDSDKDLYLRLMHRHGTKAGMRFIAQCLMENHVHLIAIPSSKESFIRGIAETHRKYTTIINIREDWKGYLWQGRFLSYPMDESYLYSAIRYVERNPVRAGFVEKAEEYPWSNARAHIFKCTDPLLSGQDNFLRIENWASYLKEKEEEAFIEKINIHERNGRPLGEARFVKKLEKMTGRRLLPRAYSYKKGTHYCVPL